MNGDEQGPIDCGILDWAIVDCNCFLELFIVIGTILKIFLMFYNYI
jgi:hypothetical protein